MVGAPLPCPPYTTHTHTHLKFTWTLGCSWEVPDSLPVKEWASLLSSSLPLLFSHSILVQLNSKEAGAGGGEGEGSLTQKAENIYLYQILSAFRILYYLVCTCSSLLLDHKLRVREVTNFGTPYYSIALFEASLKKKLKEASIF